MRKSNWRSFPPRIQKKKSPPKRDLEIVTPRKFNIAPENLMIGRLVFFWDCLFLGAMLNFWDVHDEIHNLHYRTCPLPCRNRQDNIVKQSSLSISCGYHSMILPGKGPFLPNPQRLGAVEATHIEYPLGSTPLAVSAPGEVVAGSGGWNQGATAGQGLLKETKVKKSL